MKRTFLISSTLAGLSLIPTLASAEPGILYVPTEDVTLRPLNVAPCGSSVNSALGCGGVATGEPETTQEPYADAEALATAMADALVDYDVMVTHVRPPDYISYVMLMAGDDPVPEGISFTCTSGGISCGARARSRMIFTSGTTTNCMDPVITHAALHAFGRISGLEGIDNPEDYMHYVPDYTLAPMGFMDSCSDRVNQLAINDEGDVVMQLFECTSLDHFECPDGANGEPGQNSHQDLLMYYGTRTEDADPPELTNVLPGEGAVIMAGEDLVLDVDIADADPIVGVRWTVTNEVFVDSPVGSNTFTQCTNDVCFANWNDVPFKATDSDWQVVLSGLPAGEYPVTLEAADYHGNVAEMVSFTVTIEPAEGGTTGGMDSGGNVDDTGGNVTNGGGFESTGDDGDDDDTGSGQDDSGSGSGCSCRTTPAPGGAMLMLLGLVGLSTLRRRG